MTGPGAALLDRGEALARTQGAFLVLLGGGVALLTALGADRAAGVTEAVDSALTLLVPATVVVGSACAAGVVAPELSGGAALLWIQKGRGGIRTYLRRYVERLLLGWAAGLCLLGGQSVALVLPGGEGGTPGAAALLLGVGGPVILPLVLVGASTTWLLSCAGVRGDAMAALLLLPLWVLAAALPGVPAPLARALDLTGPPPELVGMLLRLQQEGGWAGWGQLWNALLQHAGWTLATVAAGAGLLALRLRAPFPTETAR